MIRNGVPLKAPFPFEACSSSRACDMEEMSSESWSRLQDKEETTSEVSWTAAARRRGKEAWRLEPEGEAEMPEVKVLWNEEEGVSVNPEGGGHHEQIRVKIIRREREEREKMEIRGPKRKVIRVESEETRDYVR